MLGTCTIVSDKGDSGSSGLAVPPLIQKAGQDGRIPCAVCGRKFAADRIGTHQRICRKVNSKGETNVFDVASQRVKEIKDQLPPTIMKKNKQYRSKKLNNSVTRFGGKKSGASTNQLNDNRGFSAVNNKKSNWRAQHESFIASVRNAKKISAFMRNGGDAKDLASLPLINTQAESDTMQYVFCPHCSRNFRWVRTS